jgi:adenylate cyclase class 2
VAEEVEVKARADLEKVRERLAELGAVFVGVEEQEDVYFEHPCRSLLAGDEALRLRVAGGRAELTYKGPRGSGSAKSRVEVTVPVGDAAAARALLEQLGFREAVRVRKRRELYRLGGVEVALDTVEGLGTFVELESKGAPGERLIELLELLGAGEPLRETYAELVAKAARSPARSGSA